MKQHLMPAMVLVICAAFVGAGCGGDDDETTTATTTTEAGASGASGASGEEGQAAGGGLLDDAFAEEANAVCEETNKEIEALFEGFDQGEEPTQADIEKAGEDAVPIIDDTIKQLEALGEPEEGAEEYQQFLDDAQAASDEIEKDPALFGEEGPKDPFADVNKQAEELGLPACS